MFSHVVIDLQRSIELVYETVLERNILQEIFVKNQLYKMLQEHSSTEMFFYLVTKSH